MSNTPRSPLGCLLLGVLTVGAGCTGAIAPGGSSSADGTQPPGGNAGAAGAPASVGNGGRGGAPMSSGAGGATSGVMIPPVVIPPPSSACQMAGTRPGPSPMRRLTGAEYDNTVAELLGDTSAPAKAFPADAQALGFDNNAEVSQTSLILVEQYETAADALARKAAQDLPKLMGCTPANAAAEDGCARTFIEGFGLRAFRRPLTRDEVDQHVAFYAASKTRHGFAAAVRMVVQAFLQSPFFIYRVEGLAAPATGVVKAVPYEVATRLSFLLWSSMPDKALFDAAAANQLQTPAQIDEQARRMLADPRARQGVGNFFAQWLDLAHLQRTAKDPQTYPKWNTALPGLLRQETETFVREVVLHGDGTIQALFQAPYSYLNKELAAFYGATAPAGAGFEKVMLDPKRRAGVLTHASFLAAAAAPRQSSPVARGIHVLERFLCAPPPPAPPNVNATFPEPDGKTSTRERLAQHRANPSCAGCHMLIDPIGLAFEHYDGIGLWRDQDAGKPVNATGEIVGTRDANGAIDGAIDLATRLVGSGQARDCTARQFFRFAFGRAEQESDACTLELLGNVLGRNGSVRELLVALTQTDPFVYRTVAAP